MSQDRQIEIVKELYAALPAGDWDAYKNHTHADFRVVESESLPYAGVFHGMDGFMQLIEKVFGMFSEFDAQPNTFAAGGNMVMVEVNIKMTGRASGNSIHTQLIEVFKFEGEKVIEICPFYFNTDLVNSIV